MEGFNATIFCYGATSAGKTHTYEDLSLKLCRMLGTPQYPGVMFHAVRDLLDAIQVDSDNYDYVLRLFYLEIYNEILKDLLDPRKPGAIRKINYFYNEFRNKRRSFARSNCLWSS
jgi:hypothetical protein